MNRLPVVSWSDVATVLKRAGFVYDRQKGSHMVYYHPETNRTVVFPKHKEIKRGTLREILREADITLEKFRELLG